MEPQTQIDGSLPSRQSREIARGKRHRALRSCVRRALSESGAFDGVRRAAIAFSGGVDSSVLLHLLADLRREGGPELAAVHIHHGLRGVEADRDAASAERLARKEKVEFHIAYLPRTGSHVSEHRLRELRMKRLEEIAYELRAERIVLAHHADDQAETLLLRLLQGSDARGLGGMRIFRPPLWVRPLLRVRREEILREATSCRIKYVEDSTNRLTHYRRNFLRKNILPTLTTQFNPRLTEHLTALAESMARVSEFLELESEKLLSRAKRGEGNYDARILQAAPEALRHSAIQQAFRKIAGETAALRRPQLHAIDRMILAADKKTFSLLPRHIRAIRKKGEISFKRVR